MLYLKANIVSMYFACARMTSVTDRIFSIAIFIISLVGTLVSRGQTTSVLCVPVTKGDIAAGAGVGLVCADISTPEVYILHVINFTRSTCINKITGGVNINILFIWLSILWT